MKLLVSCATLGHGGAERVLSILSHAFADSFDEVIYLMWLKDEVFYKIDPRVKLVFLPDLSGQNNRYRELLSFRRFVKRENPDLILSFLTPFNMLVEAATIGLKTKVVVCERNDPHYVPGGKIMEWLRDLTYKRAYGILAQTDYSRSCYKGKLKDKTTVIYNPVTMPKDMVGSAFTTKKEDVIITVGRLHPQKNQKMLLEAFAIFVAKHPTFELVIYGEGPLKQELTEYAEKLGIGQSVKLKGHSNEVWNEIKKARVFALSSIAEGMSNALIEAMCLGMPVVSTKVAGAVDLIKDGENGYLVDQNDSTLMAERLSRIVDDGILSKQLGLEASKLYQMLNVDIICNQWVDYITKTIKR